MQITEAAAKIPPADFSFWHWFEEDGLIVRWYTSTIKPAPLISPDFTWTASSAQYVLILWMLSLSLFEIEKARDMLNDIMWKEQTESNAFGTNMMYKIFQRTEP